jgi:hypothetical protein
MVEVRHRIQKKFISLYLVALLTAHFSTITYALRWVCECDGHRGEVICCCNCPKCVDEREGLYSYCHSTRNPRSDEKKNGLVLASPNCLCGSGKAIYHGSDEAPYLQPAPIICFADMSLTPSKPADPSLQLEEWIHLLDRPG